MINGKTKELDGNWSHAWLGTCIYCVLSSDFLWFGFEYLSF